jgi:hypothetical protein
MHRPALPEPVEDGVWVLTINVALHTMLSPAAQIKQLADSFSVKIDCAPMTLSVRLVWH